MPGWTKSMFSIWGVVRWAIFAAAGLQGGFSARRSQLSVLLLGCFPGHFGCGNIVRRPLLRHANGQLVLGSKSNRRNNQLVFYKRFITSKNGPSGELKTLTNTKKVAKDLIDPWQPRYGNRYKPS